MTHSEKPRFVGTQGWKQFLTSKERMLSAFDQAKEQAAIRKVETYHGEVAEAEFRKWLEDFLPKRYGITSGYVISQGARDDAKLPHFDVIIYSVLDSPVLWVEASPDRSSPGMSRAIPAEYVYAVLEVKSSFDTRSVKKAIEHLEELNPLLEGVDKSSERYKEYLPANFFSSVVFFEVRTNQFNAATLNALNDIEIVRGFFGGIILRGEGFQPIVSGRIHPAISDKPIESVVGKKKKSLLSKFSFSDFRKVKEKEFIGTALLWTQIEFARYAFDLVAALEGTYDVGKLSSFHGISWLASQKGPQSWDDI